MNATSLTYEFPNLSGNESFTLVVLEVGTLLGVVLFVGTVFRSIPGTVLPGGAPLCGVTGSLLTAILFITVNAPVLVAPARHTPLFSVTCGTWAYSLQAEIHRTEPTKRSF